MGGGAFDYLAYPPIPGNLQQTIQNALLGRQRHFQENGEGAWASNQQWFFWLGKLRTTLSNCCND